MISSISFEKDLLMSKEDAEELNLKYTISPKIGINYNGEVEIINSWDCYKSQCIEKDGKFYRDQKGLDEDKPVSGSYLYTEYTGPIEYVLVKKEHHLVDLNIFAQRCKYKFYIEESITSKEPTIDNIQVILQHIEDKASMLNELVNKIKSNTFNSKTNVHVGGGLITTYNELMLKENSCTDDLQTELNNGWRIIAVCVQPDQRRPDYILGRYNPNLDVYSKPSADR